jgi:glutathione S-transferase
MADITVWAGLLFAHFARIDVPDDCNALRAWKERVDGRASVVNPA